MGVQQATRIWYLDGDSMPADEKAFHSNVPFSTPGARLTNLASAPRDVMVEDIRDRRAQFSLDQNGFQVLSHETEFKDWYNGRTVAERYYQEMAEWLKQALGADEVFVFNHTVCLKLQSFLVKDS
jgi:hypothetical protein